MSSLAFMLSMLHGLVLVSGPAPILRTNGFERLYTNAELDGLVDRLQDLIASISDLHVGRPHLRVSGKCDKPPKWYAAAPDRVHIYTRGCQYHHFTVQTARSLLPAVIRNSFLLVGDHVFRQGGGIPMGCNASVNIANYYLFHL